MKKAISIGLVALTILAAALFFLQIRRYLPETPRAAQLAPAETLFFAQMPNLRTSAQRFQQTNLHAIWLEPEVQAFLQKPRAQSPDVRKWEARGALCTRVAPGEAFLAVTAAGGAMPKFVAGFSYAGRRGDAESLVGALRGELLGEAAKAGGQSHKAAAIQTYDFPGGGVYAECFVRNWCFAATDLPLLRSTLDRLQAPATALSGTLAGSEAYAKAIAALGAAQDVVVYGRLGVAGPAATAPSPVRGVSAISAGSKMEGGQFRDRVFLLNETGQEKPAPLHRSTLIFSGRETLLYLAFRTSALAHLAEYLAFFPGVAGFVTSPSWHGFDEAFGPELGITLEWTPDAAMPAALLVCEVRDSVKARAWLDMLTAGSEDAPPWSRREEAHATHYTAPVSKVSLLQPTVMLTPRHALLGISPDAIAGGLRPLETPEATLATAPAFQKAADSVAPARTSFGYLHTGALVDRGLRTLRPVLTMSLAFSEGAGEYLDAGRLPSSDAVARHLTPSVYSQTSMENGELFESVGSVTFQHLGLGAVLGTVGANLPQISTVLAGSGVPAVATPLNP